MNSIFTADKFITWWYRLFIIVNLVYLFIDLDNYNKSADFSQIISFLFLKLILLEKSSYAKSKRPLQQKIMITFVCE